MRKSRKTDKEVKNTLDVIKENSKTIAENSQTVVVNTERTNEKLDDMKSDMAEIKKNSASKVGTIIAVIGVLVAVSGVSVIGLIDRWRAKTEAGAETAIAESEPEAEPEPEYAIYLYPEYSTFSIGAEIDMTASLNFETDAVSITAHLASGEEDTLELYRKNTTEWQKKVVFTETGVHEIIATATAPNGEVIESSIEVEVTPISIDMDIDMDFINQLFSP